MSNYKTKCRRCVKLVAWRKIGGGGRGGSNQTVSLLVLLTYPFKHFNWQTPSNPLTAPGGVLVEHQTDGGKI